MKRSISNIFAPIVEPLVEMVFEALLKKFFEKQPDHAKVLLVSLYPVIDAELEPIFDETENPFDDNVVDGLKKAFEKVAEENKIDLPNLDND